MKFTINRKVFVNSLKKVTQVISRKTTIPILTCLKIDASSKGIILTGSNSDMTVQDFTSTGDKSNQLTIDAGGSIAITANLFSSIIPRLPGKLLAITTNQSSQVHVKSGQSEFNLHGMDSSNYPHLPKVDGENIELPSNILKEIINQTIFATSSSQDRPVLTGVHFLIQNSTLTAVATDGHRLSARSIQLPNVKTNFDVVIPADSLKELLKLVASASKVDMRLSSNQAMFAAGNNIMYTRLIEGNYPKVAPIIPKSSNTQLKFDASDLLATINRASIISHEGKNNVVQMVVSKSGVRIVADSADVGHLNEAVATQNVAGKELKIYFNPDYVSDALKCLDGMPVEVDLISPISPMVIKPSNNEAGKFIQLVTPIRTI